MTPVQEITVRHTETLLEAGWEPVGVVLYRNGVTATVVGPSIRFSYPPDEKPEE